MGFNLLCESGENNEKPWFGCNNRNQMFQDTVFSNMASIHFIVKYSLEETVLVRNHNK